MSELPAAEAFFLPDEGELDPRTIAAELVREHEEFRDLRHGEALIMFLMRRETKLKGGKMLLGQAVLPRFNGSLAELGAWLLAKACGGEEPDFLMILDATWWEQASPIQRKALVHHELKHMGVQIGRDGEPRFTDEGKPVWGILAHDIEEFGDVVRLYGDSLPDVREFALALCDGGVI